MKKIAIGILIVLVAIFVFLAIQLNYLSNSLTEQLAKRQIKVQKSALQFFPAPAIHLEKLQYEKLSIASLDANLAFWPLFTGKALLESLSLKQTKSSDDAVNSADIQAKFENLNLSHLLSGNLPFRGPSQINIELAHPIYGNQKQFALNFAKGNIASQGQGRYLLQFVDTSLNQQPLGYIESYIDLQAPIKTLTAYIRPDCDSNCLATFKIAHQPNINQSNFNFFGNNFPTAHLAKLLGIPNTLTGNADFDIQLQFNQSALTRGLLEMDISNGEILGFNLLDLAAQYLPVNYNSELLNGKNLNTHFDHFTSTAMIENGNLRIANYQLNSQILLASGEGKVDLKNAQCDFQLNLSLNNPKYRQLVLPIHFFDSCYSPQYKIQITKDFRNKIKDIIKEKIKRN